MKKRIFYHDTDCGGVVYYANYLKYMEEARTEYFERKGISLQQLSDQGVLFVVARQEIDYKSPARYGDVLDVTTRFAEVGAVKMTALHEVSAQDGRLICAARTVMVCVGPDIKPRAIPDDLKRIFKEDA